MGGHAAVGQMEGFTKDLTFLHTGNSLRIGRFGELARKSTLFSRLQRSQSLVAALRRILHRDDLLQQSR